MKHLITLIIIVCLVLPSWAQTERLSPEKLWEMGRVSLYDVSADGKQLLYGVTYYDLAANGGSRDLYLVNTQTNESIQLTQTPESEGAACFAPTGGNQIYFLRGGKLWTMNTEDSEMEQVSNVGMNGFKISPDGSRILYITDVKKDPSLVDLYPDLPLADARIMDDLMYRHWDTWEDGAYSNIFVADLDGGSLSTQPVNIMDEPYDSPVKPFGGMEQINWSYNGQAIFYTCKKIRGKEYAQSTNTDIYRYDLNSGETTNVSAQNEGYDIDPVASPDGRYLVWNSMKTPGFEADRNRIMLHNLQSGETTELSAGWDYSANHPTFSADGQTLFFSTGVRATYHLFSIELTRGKGSKPKQLTEGIWNYNDFLVAPDALYSRRCSMSQPHEIVRIGLTERAITPVTKVNEKLLSQLTMGKVEKRIV
ncbi:MAG: peptidase S9, partial [Bacteroidota bacterium]